MKKKTWKILDVAVTVNGSVYLLLRRLGNRYEVRVVDGLEYGSAVFVISNRFRKISGEKQVEITKEDVLKRLFEFGVWYCRDDRCVYIGGMDFFEEDVYRTSKFVCRGGNKRIFDTVLSMANSGELNNRNPQIKFVELPKIEYDGWSAEDLLKALTGKDLFAMG